MKIDMPSTFLGMSVVGCLAYYTPETVSVIEAGLFLCLGAASIYYVWMRDSQEVEDDE